MSFSSLSESILKQQFEQLSIRLEYLEGRRMHLRLYAAIPAVGWGAWGGLGAFLTGDPVGAAIVVAITLAIAGGLFIPRMIVETVALTGAFVVAFLGWGYPALFGGYILMGWFTAGLVFVGVRACWKVVKNDTEISRIRDRLEELAKNVGQPVPWLAAAAAAPKEGDELEVEPGWDEGDR